MSNLSWRTAAQDLFDNVASEVWLTLKHSRDMSFSIGEETLSDLGLLKLLLGKLPMLKIYKTTKAEEARTGVDWEFWIRYRHKYVVRYAIQAKKLFRDNKYNSIWHRNPTTKALQADLLNAYAQDPRTRSVPLYCFFNYFAQVDLSQHYHCECKANQQAGDLGCTIVHARRIRGLKGMQGVKTFDHMHRRVPACPWRCLFCRHLAPDRWLLSLSWPDITVELREHEAVYPSFPIPDDLAFAETEDVELFELTSDFYDLGGDVAPRYVVFMDFQDSQ